MHPGPLRRLGPGDQNAQVARLFHRRCREAGPEALKILKDGLSLLGERGRCALLLTGAGLVWASRTELTDHSRPSETESDEITEQAHQIAQKLRDDLGLTEDNPEILLGIDIFTESRERERATGQFAALLTAVGVTLIPKGLPRSDEAVYVPDGVSHLVKIKWARRQRAMVFVCHDVAALHRRGEATTTRPDRRDWRSALVGETGDASVGIGLHLVHDMSKVGSFTDPYNNWGGPEPLLGAAGLSGIDHERDALALAAALRRGDDFPVLDLWEG